MVSTLTSIFVVWQSLKRDRYIERYWFCPLEQLCEVSSSDVAHLPHERYPHVLGHLNYCVRRVLELCQRLRDDCLVVAAVYPFWLAENREIEIVRKRIFIDI